MQGCREASLRLGKLERNWDVQCLLQKGGKQSGPSGDARAS